MIVRSSEGFNCRMWEICIGRRWSVMIDVRLHLGLDCLHKHWGAFQHCDLLYEYSVFTYGIRGA